MAEVAILKNNQDASSKWSGYNYQGKVALYVALYLINNPKKLDKKFRGDWNIYSLEIEGVEDFSILKNNLYFSIHQVKAYTSSTYLSTFNDALWGLIGKTIENNSATKSCLHTLKKINELDKRTQVNIDTIKLLNPAKPIGKSFKEKYIDDEAKLKVAFKKLAFYKSHKLYDLDVDLDEINELIKEQIKIYFKKNNFEEYKTGNDYIDASFNKLLFLIDVYIYRRHNKELRQTDYLSFKDIIKSLETTVDLANHEFFLFNIRTHIGEAIAEHCYACVMYDEPSCESCNLMKYKQESVWVENDEFIHFLRNINAHINFDRNNIKIGDFMEIITYKCGYNSLLEAIKIKEDDYPGIVDNKITYSKDSKRYMSTTISHTQKSTILKQAEIMKISQSIAKSLKEDPNLLMNLHGINGFISNDISVKSVKNKANQIGRKNLSETDDVMKNIKSEYDWGSKIVDDLSIIKFDYIVED